METASPHEASRRSWIRDALVLGVVGLALAGAFPVLAAQAAAGSGGPSFGEILARLVALFLVFSLVGLVLLVGTVAWLFWRIKKLVENAVRPNLPKLRRLAAKLQAKYPDLDERGLARKIMLRQSNRAGLVGFVTGLGGLPFLPIAIPIDIALTIKIQSNLVHLLRLVRGEADATSDELSDASLWLITTGGQELTSVSGKLIRELLVSFLSKSLLKFVPLLGGVVGFLLNWISTQALGRLTVKWLESKDTPAPATPAPAVDRPGLMP